MSQPNNDSSGDAAHTVSPTPPTAPTQATQATQVTPDTQAEQPGDAQASADSRGAKERIDCTKYKIADLDVAVWKPAAQGKAPLVVFSHGFGGSNTQSKFIMEALARSGYLVVAPNHQDANGLMRGLKPQVGFGKAGQWDDTTYADRRDDIKKLLDALHEDPLWDKQIDWSRLALSGHSLGGYTALGLAGAWPSWKIDGVKAVLALSPYCSPYSLHGNLDHLVAPVMYQGGTRDMGITPTLKGPQGAFSKTGPPAYFVEFDQVGHFSWTGFNRNIKQQDLIDYYCVSFLDKYVKGSVTAQPETKLAGVTELETK